MRFLAQVPSVLLCFLKPEIIMAERSRHKQAKSATREDRGKIHPKKSSASAGAGRSRQGASRPGENWGKGGSRRGSDESSDRPFRSKETSREDWQQKRSGSRSDASAERSGRGKREYGERGSERPFRSKERSGEGWEKKRSYSRGDTGAERSGRGKREYGEGGSDRSFRSKESSGSDWQKKRSYSRSDAGTDRPFRSKQSTREGWEKREDWGRSRPKGERGEAGSDRPFRPKRSADAGEWGGARGEKKSGGAERSRQGQARAGREYGKGDTRRGNDRVSDRPFRSKENSRDEWEKKRPHWSGDAETERPRRSGREEAGDRKRPYPNKERGGERAFSPKRSSGDWSERSRGEKKNAPGERSWGGKSRGGEDRGKGGSRRGGFEGSERPRGEKRNDERENFWGQKSRGGEDRAKRPVRKESSEGSEHPRRPVRGQDPIGERPVKQKKTIREEQGKIRLNKAIADAGLMSRRKADEMIAAGEVRVNGMVVQELGMQVELSDKIEVRGKLIGNPDRERYILLNKPKDTITTTKDERGRRTVVDLVEAHERLFPVGRLDRHTTGVLLLTNDGDMAYRLTHPSYEIERVYEVVLDKEISLGDARAIAQGVPIGKGETSQPCYLSVEDSNRQNVTVVIREGKNREVRRMFESRDYQVKKLNRVSYAGLTYQGLQRGEWRELKKHEVRELRKRLKLD